MAPPSSHAIAMKFKLNMIHEFALFLGVLSAATIAFNPRSDVLLHLALTLGFGLVLYWVYTLCSSKRKNVWNTVITTLILFLILHPATEMPEMLLVPLLATFAAITQKFFIEIKGSPIINPAVFGILVAAGVIALMPNVDLPFNSWWGTSFGSSFGEWSLPIPLVALLIVGLWVAFGMKKWRKWTIVCTFLVCHAALLFGRGLGAEFIQYTFTDSTIYFFATAMLVEPKTSPLRKGEQTVYGALAALLYNTFMHLGVPYFILFALAGANLFHAGMRLKRPKPARP